MQKLAHGIKSNSIHLSENAYRRFNPFSWRIFKCSCIMKYFNGLYLFDYYYFHFCFFFNCAEFERCSIVASGKIDEQSQSVKKATQ
jgi:hypothetical protein